MFSIILEALEETAGICLLVMLMMPLIELFNVSTSGRLFSGLEKHPFGQVLLSALLGITPGCMGGFAGVSLYSHRMVGFGSLVAMLIATTGDESLLMLSLFPGKALALFAGLLLLAVAVGTATDAAVRSMQKKGLLLGLGGDRKADDNYEIHSCDREEESHEGHVHPESKGHRAMHFLKEHIWHHVICRHLPSIFAWTFGVLLAVGILSMYIDIETWIRGNTALMVFIAVIIGLIPQSGPHMVFVTMFASGMLPFSVLLANSISQDGHACLPLLAENKRSFVWAKLLKSVLALAAGFIAMAI